MIYFLVLVFKKNQMLNYVRESIDTNLVKNYRISHLNLSDNV